MAHGTIWARSSSMQHRPQHWSTDPFNEINISSQTGRAVVGESVVRTIFSAVLSVRCPDTQMALLDPFDWTGLTVAACTGVSAITPLVWPDPVDPAFGGPDHVTGTAMLKPDNAFRNRDNTGWIFNYVQDEVIDTAARRLSPVPSETIVSLAKLRVIVDPGFMFNGSVASYTVSWYHRTLFNYPV